MCLSMLRMPGDRQTDVKIRVVLELQASTNWVLCRFLKSEIISLMYHTLPILSSIPVPTDVSIMPLLYSFAWRRFLHGLYSSQHLLLARAWSVVKIQFYTDTCYLQVSSLMKFTNDNKVGNCLENRRKRHRFIWIRCSKYTENHLGRKKLKIFNRKQKSGNKNSTKNRAVAREGWQWAAIRLGKTL